MNFDIVITNGKIIDGAGNPWYQADVGIENGKISKIGRLGTCWTAETEIDAAGRIVAPGFIDLHTHNDVPFHFDNRLPSIGVRWVKERSTRPVVDLWAFHPEKGLSDILDVGVAGRKLIFPNPKYWVLQVIKPV